MVIVLTSICADETLARRVLSVARSIAPNIDSLDSDATADATAILNGIATEAAARGIRSVDTNKVGTALVKYASPSSWFTEDDRAALRAICKVVATSGHPIGDFPPPDRAYRGVWPEGGGPWISPTL